MRPARRLSVPLSFLLIEAVRRQQAERMAEAEAAQRAAQNPFADMFKSRASAGAGGGRASGFGGGMQSSRATRQSGPVIDAEWTSLDDSEGKRK